ncbi:MAG: hypothetical protein JNG83_00635 [Opitutaceae bacterium]|nr:hypothetical protein [Opitutaceae bacterium]
MQTPRLVIALLFSISAGGFIAAGSAAVTAESAQGPAYPRVDLAPRYEVDSSWPERPPGVQWGGTPSIAVAPDDTIWVFTRKNPMVQVYDAAGHFIKSWEEKDARAVPHAIRFDAQGNVWLVDAGLHVVRKFDRDGKLLLELGTLGEAGLDGTHFSAPTDVCFQRNGDIFVSDGYGNSRIAHFDATGRFIKSWGTMGVAPGQFSIPHSIACDSQGRLYVADRNNVRIQIFDANGRLLDTWANVVVPWGIWISPQDEIWVCGSSPMHWRVDPDYPTAPLGCPPQDQLFMKFTPEGRVLQLTMLPKGKDHHERPGEVNWIHTLALDKSGNVYAGDIIGQRAQKFLRK